MKKVVLSLALLTGTVSLASAQSNVIKANIFSPLVKTGSFFYERQINDKATAQLGVFFTGVKSGDTKFSGFGITPEYRFYVSGEAMNGFYVGPYLRYQSFDLTTEYQSQSFDNNGNLITKDEKDEAKLSTFGGGIMIGRQWLFSERFALDPFLGLGYNAGSLKAEGGSDEETFDVGGSFKGFGIRAGLSIGIAF